MSHDDDDVIGANYMQSSAVIRVLSSLLPLLYELFLLFSLYKKCKQNHTVLDYKFYYMTRNNHLGASEISNRLLKENVIICFQRNTLQYWKSNLF